jgi:hypothetical protein
MGGVIDGLKASSTTNHPALLNLMVGSLGILVSNKFDSDGQPVAMTPPLEDKIHSTLSSRRSS